MADLCGDTNGPDGYACELPRGHVAGETSTRHESGARLDDVLSGRFFGRKVCWATQTQEQSDHLHRESMRRVLRHICEVTND
jgi:hypothetical protein